MRKSLPNSFEMDAEDIAITARSRLKDVDIDSTYEALMEADKNGEATPDDLTDAQVWALRALGWVSLAYEAQADGWGPNEDRHCLQNAQISLGESTHHARKPAEFSAMQSERSRNPAWYTEPLIKMCKKIRRSYPFYTAKDIFNALPEAPSIDPIGKIDHDEDGLTIIEKTNDKKTPKTTGRPISMSGFGDFCTRNKILKPK